MKKTYPIDPLYPEHINIFWFHLTNLLIHTGVVLLIFFLIRRMFQDERLAFITGLIFSLHPVHVEAVTSIVGRAESLCALFYLASLILFIREREKKRLFTPLLLVSYFLFLAALLSKESGVTLPLIVLMTDWFIEARKEKKTSFPFFTQAFLRILPYMAVLGVYLNWRLRVIGALGILPSAWYFFDEPANLRLSYMCVAALVYLRLLLFPLSLSMDYNFPVRVLGSFWAEKPQGWGDFWVLSGVFFLFLFLVWIVQAAYRRQAISFPLLFLTITFFPFTNLIPFGEFIAERFLYLPSLGFCLLVGIGITKLLEKSKTRKITFLILGVILLSFSVRTFFRNRDWESSLELWQAEKKFNPRNPNLYYGFGLEYQMKRMYYTVKIKKALSERENSKINDYQDRIREYENLAVQNFEESLQKNPRHYLTCLTYGGLFLSMKDPDLDRAEEVLLQGAALMPENIKHLHTFYHYLGIIQLLKIPRNTEQCFYFLQKAHQLRKGDKDILLSIIYTNILMKRYREAIRLCREVLKSDPANKMAIYYLKQLRTILN